MIFLLKSNTFNKNRPSNPKQKDENGKQVTVDQRRL